MPLLPTVLATGWASLLIWITGIPLNPMSAALGALTIAIATEFAVILSGRFEQERSVGLDVAAALRRAYARTGAAVLASGLTAIAGFAVLIASDIRMLRDFGAVTVIDLAAALLGVDRDPPGDAGDRRAALVGEGRGVPMTRARGRRRGVSSVKSVTNRYSLLVGLLFLVADRDRHDPHPDRRRRRHRSGSKTSRRAGRSREFAVPAAAGTLEGDANVYQDDCGSASLPCPEHPPRVPACQITTRRRDPRLRPLRPPAGDLVLVRHRKQLRARARRGQRGRRALPWSGELPVARQSSIRAARFGNWSAPTAGTMPVGFDRDGAVAALFQIGRLPDLRLRLSGRHAAERRASANLASGRSATMCENF